MRIKNQQGIALILEIVLIAVVVTVVGAVAFKSYQSQSQGKSAAIEQTKADLPTKTAVVSTADWKTYQSADENLSFKYPASWKASPINEQPEGGTVNTVRLTAPSGLTLRFTSAASGLGGACEVGSCPDVQTYRVTAIPNTNAKTPLYLVEGSIKSNSTGDPAKGKYIPRMGLIGKTLIGSTEVDVPKVGEAIQSNSPYYFIFPKQNSKIVGYVMFAFEPYPSHSTDGSKWFYTKDTIQEFFNLPDVQTAKLVLQSVKY